ncbi:hypothetical protein SAY86_000975 [Trapa natans]|uniref:Uncharacterized protein n=1 Tax=Trapa natans TaxID=22666 RepID=A0AAN7RG26_TRANT|nr:hypothetical protein SAY86_000975 [Trapa natans]
MHDAGERCPQQYRHIHPMRSPGSLARPSTLASAGLSVSRFRGHSRLEMVSRDLPLSLAQVAEGS